MITFFLDHWLTMLSLLTGGGTLGALLKIGPRLLATLDCEADRIRWQERDRLRDGEITLLRRQVENLQADVTRLLERSVASGAVSDPVTATESLTTILPPTSGL